MGIEALLAGGNVWTDEKRAFFGEYLPGVEIAPSVLGESDKITPLGLYALSFIREVRLAGGDETVDTDFLPSFSGYASLIGKNGLDPFLEFYLKDAWEMLEERAGTNAAVVLHNFPDIVRTFTKRRSLHQEDLTEYIAKWGKLVLQLLHGVRSGEIEKKEFDCIAVPTNKFEELFQFYTAHGGELLDRLLRTTLDHAGEDPKLAVQYYAASKAVSQTLDEWGMSENFPGWFAHINQMLGQDTENHAKKYPLDVSAYLLSYWDMVKVLSEKPATSRHVSKKFVNDAGQAFAQAFVTLQDHGHTGLEFLYEAFVTGLGLATEFPYHVGWFLGQAPSATKHGVDLQKLAELYPAMAEANNEWDYEIVGPLIMGDAPDHEKTKVLFIYNAIKHKTDHSVSPPEATTKWLWWARGVAERKVKRKFGLSSVPRLSIRRLAQLCELQYVRGNEAPDKYAEVSAIKDILEDKVEKLFPLGKVYKQRPFPDPLPWYTSLVFRTQHGTIDDLFDNRTTFCCTLHPTGKYKYAAALQVVDPAMALVVAEPRGKESFQDPIGVAYAFFAFDSKNAKYLVVDGVEGFGLPEGWESDYFDVLRALALDTGCRYMHVNKKVHNSSAKTFVKYVGKKGGVKQKVFLSKIGGNKKISEYGAKYQFLESFPKAKDIPEEADVYEGWSYTHGRVEGYTFEIRPKKREIQEALKPIQDKAEHEEIYTPFQRFIRLLLRR